jgi:hypothetical protein
MSGSPPPLHNKFNWNFSQIFLRQTLTILYTNRVHLLCFATNLRTISSGTHNDRGHHQSRLVTRGHAVNKEEILTDFLGVTARRKVLAAFEDLNACVRRVDAEFDTPEGWAPSVRD